MALPELQALRRWILWRFEPRDDKRTKVPYDRANERIELAPASGLEIAPMTDRNEAELRHIYPAEDDPAALRVEMTPAGISVTPDVSIIATDAGTHGGSEVPVKIVMSPAQAADLARRLQAVLNEL
jgi:hypothetical protein